MASCSLCIIENTCTQVRLVTDRELADPVFIRRLRDFCFALNISSYHWLDFLTDQYRDLRGCIVDQAGRTVFLDMEVSKHRTSATGSAISAAPHALRISRPMCGRGQRTCARSGDGFHASFDKVVFQSLKRALR
jgi:hypothetical protein